MNYTFHPHAERELEEIESHYDSILHELGNRFREDVEMTISVMHNRRRPDYWTYRS
jgi:hypothetical protein